MHLVVQLVNERSRQRPKEKKASLFHGLGHDDTISEGFVTPTTYPDAHLNGWVAARGCQLFEQEASFMSFHI